jgi:hypothetical protein
MVRVEIIANHSVEENILDAFAREGVGKLYTKYPSVFGVGNSGPRMGDAVWPEENFALIVWCEEEEARGIARAVAAVKKQFPDEGLRIFGIHPEGGRFPHAAEAPWPVSHGEARGEPHAGVHAPVAPAPVYAAPAPPPVPPAPSVAPPVYTLPVAPAPPVYTQPVAPAPPAYTPPPGPAPEPPPAPPDAAPGSGSADSAHTSIGTEYDGQNMEY